jgi:hypothetical protein
LRPGAVSDDDVECSPFTYYFKPNGDWDQNNGWRRCEKCGDYIIGYSHYEAYDPCPNTTRVVEWDPRGDRAPELMNAYASAKSFRFDQMGRGS